MNIAFILANSIEEVGGIERATTNLAHEFESHGHTIYFVSRKNRESSGADARQHFFLGTKVSSKENEDFLLSFLGQKQIDLVIFQNGDDAPVPFPPIYKKARTHLLVAVHSDPEWFEKHIRSKVATRRISKIAGLFKSFCKRRKVAKMYRLNAKFAEKIVLLSPSFIPAMAKYIDPVDREKLVAIPNPSARTLSEHLGEKKKEILFVGRLHNMTKRVDLLLEAWALLEKRFPEWGLHIVGDGPDRKFLENLAKELELSHVFFDGFREPWSFYQNAAILALTSFYEGFGMVLVEAQAFGCVPVVFNSFSAVHDIIEDGVSGVLVPAFDIEKYAEKLSELMSNPEYREGLALNAQKSVSRFSPEKIGAQWEKLFQEL